MHTIRQATLSDLPTLRQFWCFAVMMDTYPEDQIEDSDTATRQLATMLTYDGPDPLGFAFLAEEDGAPLGFIIYQIHQRAIGLPRRYAFCSHHYVLPEARGRGIGSDLIEVAVAHGLSQGITSVELNTEPLDATPKSPYERALGHTVVALRMKTTPAHLLAQLDRRREAREARQTDIESRANGHDTDTVTLELPHPVIPREE